MQNQAIADALLKDIPAWEGTPFYALSSGGPASHKCLFSDTLNRHNRRGFLTLNDELLEHFFEKDIPFPHHEKSASNILRYYDLVDTIVKEAGRRHVSIVFEDHGDYPQVYAAHLKYLAPLGYQNLLVHQTISPRNYDAKIKHRMETEGIVDHRAWGKAYHRRIVHHVDELAKLFSEGVLIETKPASLSRDRKEHAYVLAHFSHRPEGVQWSVGNEHSHKILQSWQVKRLAKKYVGYFTHPDRLMETRWAAQQEETAFTPATLQDTESSLLAMLQPELEQKKARRR